MYVTLKEERKRRNYCDPEENGNSSSCVQKYRPLGCEYGSKYIKYIAYWYDYLLGCKDFKDLIAELFKYVFKFFYKCSAWFKKKLKKRQFNLEVDDSFYFIISFVIVKNNLIRFYFRFNFERFKLF